MGVTILLSHSRALMNVFSEDQLATILTMVVGKQFSKNILREPIDTVRQFEVAAANYHTI